MVKKFGLGRGLGSLIPDDKDQAEVNFWGDDNINDKQTDQPAETDDELSIKDEHKTIYVDPYSISTSHFQPRKLFEHTALEELVNSIKEHGILEPLIVSPLGKGKYRLIAGERRLRAAKILNLDKVPVIVRSVSEQQRLEMSLIENVQRRDLNPLEEAHAYKRLIDEFNMTQEEVSRHVGKSRSKIANTLRLLTLPDEIKKFIMSGKLSEGHAKVILEVDDPLEQLKLAKSIMQRSISVRDTEKIVKRKKRKTSLPLNKEMQRWESELSQYLQTKVRILPKKRKGGVIQIEYYHEEELLTIFKKILGNKTSE